MDSSLVYTTDLRKRFGAHQVLDGVELRIGGGTVYGLVGLNGAGKTTLIRLLLGLLEPDSGDARVAGRIPWRHEPSLYREIGPVLEHDGFWGSLTFMSNIRLFADARGVSREQTDRYLRRFWDGADILGSSRKVRTFSRGQRTQCALCRAFLGWPRVCLLDEPTVGLDVDSYDRLHQLVREARGRGAAVLISSHQLETIEQLCDRIGLLRAGVLQDLSMSSGDGGGVRWVMRWHGPAPSRSVMDVLPVRIVHMDDEGCQFDVDNPRESIPGVVAALVGEGIRIGEVRPMVSELKQAIRISAGDGAWRKENP